MQTFLMALRHDSARALELEALLYHQHSEALAYLQHPRLNFGLLDLWQESVTAAFAFAHLHHLLLIELPLHLFPLHHSLPFQPSTFLLEDQPSSWS
jgi:hypothetical protein